MLEIHEEVMKKQVPNDQNPMGQTNDNEGIEQHSKPTGGKKLVITSNSNEKDTKKKGKMSKCCK